MAKKRAHGEGSITQRSDGRWQGAITTGYTEEGKQKRRTVYGKTQKEVREKLEEVKRQLATGSYSDTKHTVKSYLAEWLKEKGREIKASTLEKKYRFCVDKYLVPRIGSIKLTKLTPMHVQAAIGEIADTVGAPTANNCRRVLFNAMKQAVRWQLVHRNPVEAVAPTPERRRELTLWTAQEAARFLDTARPHRLYALFYLGMATGLRRGELLALRWGDIQGTTLHVRYNLVNVGSKLVLQTPKTVKGTRRVALSPDVLEMLLLHRQRQEAEREHVGAVWPTVLTVQKQKGDKLEPETLSNEFVFTSEVGTLLNPHNLTRLRNNLMDAAKVPRVRLHDLRHLHASILIRQGSDPKTVADRLGHSRASFTLDTYTHLFEEQRALSAVSLTSWLTSGRGEPN